MWVCALTKWRYRCADNAFGKSLLVDVGDIENFETAGTVRGVEIFAAQNDILNVVAAVFVAFSQTRASIDMLLVIGGVSERMQMTADCRLRFIRLSPNHGVESVAAFTDVSVAPKEIYRAGAES